MSKLWNDSIQSVVKQEQSSVATYSESGEVH